MRRLRTKCGSELGHRNDVAHRGQLLNRGDCRKYIDAVKVELSAWRII